MPRQGAYWTVSFESSSRLRDAERGKEEGGGPCSRGEYCAARRVVIEDGKRRVEPKRSPRAFCDADWAIIGTCMANQDRPDDALPAITRRLMAALGDHVVAEVLIRIPFGPTEPIRLDVDAALRVVTERLSGWEEEVRTAARLSPLDSAASRRLGMRNPAARVAEACKLLAAHMTTLLGLELRPMDRWLPLPGTTGEAPVASRAGDRSVTMLSGADAGNEILWMQWLARAILLETAPRPELLLGVPCRACERHALRRADPPQHEGDPVHWSVCDECRDLMDRDEYDQWVKRNASFYRDRVTPAMVAAR